MCIHTDIHDKQSKPTKQPANIQPEHTNEQAAKTQTHGRINNPSSKQVCKRVNLHVSMHASTKNQSRKEKTSKGVVRAVGQHRSTH